MYTPPIITIWNFSFSYMSEDSNERIWMTNEKTGEWMEVSASSLEIYFEKMFNELF